MQSPRFSRESIGEAMTIDAAVGLPSPMAEDGGAPWRPLPPPKKNARRDSRAENPRSEYSRIEPDTWRTSHTNSRRESRVEPEPWRSSHLSTISSSRTGGNSFRASLPSFPSSSRRDSRIERDASGVSLPSQSSRNSRAEPEVFGASIHSTSRRTSKADPDAWKPRRSGTGSERRNSRGEEVDAWRPRLSDSSSRRNSMDIEPLRPSLSRSRANSRPDDDPTKPPHSRHNSNFDARHTRKHSRQLSESHIRNLSESHGLLDAPQTPKGYSTNIPFRYDHPVREKRKVPTWAGIPQTLEMEKRERWRRRLMDIIPIICTAPFFVVFGLVVESDKKTVKRSRFDTLNELTKVAATLFPLAFSIIVGRAFVKFATYKLEQGTTLGLLERLIGSRTVFGTIGTQIRLGSLPFLSLCIITLWLISPFGSQAAQRMLETSLSPVPSTANVTFLNTRQPSYSGLGLFQDNWFAGFASLFAASLLAPTTTKLGTADLWGNVKIPISSSLSNLKEDANGWRDIPTANFTPTYSSLFGIPLGNIPMGNSTFNIESTYLELTCSNLTSAPVRSTASPFIDPGLISTNGPFRSGINITSSIPWAMGYLGQDMSPFLIPSTNGKSTQCLDCMDSNYTSSKQVPGLLLFQDFTGTQNATSIFCVPAQAYVESVVACNRTSNGQNCAVRRQRASVLSSNPPALTLLGLNTVMGGLSRLLPQAGPVREGVDQLHNYLVSPNDNAFIQSTSSPHFLANRSNTPLTGPESRVLAVPLQDFSARLSQVVNTYLQGSLQDSTSFLTGTPLETGVPATSPEILTAGIRNQTPTITIPGTVTNLLQTFKANFPWATIFLLGSLIMLVAALFSAYIRRQSLTRDYLPYISSLVRESQFVTMPRGGVRMDGGQRAKEMRDIKVRLGDVGDVGQGWEVGTGVTLSVGQLAVMDWSGARSERGRVARGKLYM